MHFLLHSSVMAYMEIFGNASHINHQQNAGMMRHSVHSFAHTTRNVSQSVSTDFQMISSSASPKKPALPPKENRRTIAQMMTSSSMHTPPQSPNFMNDHMMIDSCIQEDQEECTTPLVGEFPIDEMDNNVVVLRNKAKAIENVRRLLIYFVFNSDVLMLFWSSLFTEKAIVRPSGGD